MADEPDYEEKWRRACQALADGQQTLQVLMDGLNAVSDVHSHAVINAGTSMEQHFCSHDHHQWPCETITRMDEALQRGGLPPYAAR